VLIIGATIYLSLLLVTTLVVMTAIVAGSRADKLAPGND
jgi:hypothetical protein